MTESKPELCPDCAQLRVELYTLLQLLARKLGYRDGGSDDDFFLLSNRDALGRKIFKDHP